MLVYWGSLQSFQSITSHMFASLDMSSIQPISHTTTLCCSKSTVSSTTDHDYHCHSNIVNQTYSVYQVFVDNEIWEKAYYFRSLGTLPAITLPAHNDTSEQHKVLWLYWLWSETDQKLNISSDSMALKLSMPTVLITACQLHAVILTKKKCITQAAFSLLSLSQ